MALPISESVVAAFRAQAQAADLNEFVVWWNTRRELLGTLRPDVAQGVFDRAVQEGRPAGIDDNQDHRVFLMAAALSLLPSPTPRTLILALDAIFAPADDDARLRDLAALRQPGR